MTDRLRLIAETGLLYAPHYVAEELDLFGDESIDLETRFDSGPGGSWLAEVLADGDADIARGGVWIPMAYHGRLEELRIFARLCDRNPQVIIAREATRDLSFASLRGTTVLLPAAATSQWMFLEGALLRAGINPASIQFIRDLELRTIVRLWKGGLGNYILCSPPVSERLLDEGYHLAGAMAHLAGQVPWSVYYGAASFVSDRLEVLVRFGRALNRAHEWMAAHEATESARLVSRHFPGFSTEQLARSIERMARDGVWVNNTAVPADAFARYQDIIHKFGLVREPIPRAEIVFDEVSAGADSG